METDNVNPEGGTVEDVARILLEKSEPKAPEESEEEAAEELPEEDNSEPVDDDEDTEASEEEGDEPEEDDEEAEDDSEQPKMVTVKIDGKSVEVPLEEALAGYMKDQDYRKKTTEVAELRKQVEAEQAKVADAATVRDNYLKELTILQELTSAPLFTEEKLAEILQTQGAEKYLQAKAAQDRHQQQQQTLRQAIGKVQTEQTEEQKAELAKREVAEREMLLTALPELKDDANQKALGSYILSLGYTEDDVKSTLDHRLFVTMEKARRYDELIAKGKQKPVAKVPKVTKGDAPRQSGSELKGQKLKELSLKAKRSGSVDDLAQLLMAKK